MIEELKKICQAEQILNEIQSLKGLVLEHKGKRWLSTKELSQYLDYSQDRIHKLKGSEFIEGIHYYKRSGKLLFDRYQIDNWVQGIETHNLAYSFNVEESINNIIENLKAS